MGKLVWLRETVCDGHSQLGMEAREDATLMVWTAVVRPDMARSGGLYRGDFLSRPVPMSARFP